MTHWITLPPEAEGVQLRKVDVSPDGASDASAETQLDDLCWLAILKQKPFCGRHFSHVTHRGHPAFLRLEQRGLVRVTATEERGIWMVEVV